jgi:hypothetical protein
MAIVVMTMFGILTLWVVTWRLVRVIHAFRLGISEGITDFLLSDLYTECYEIMLCYVRLCYASYEVTLHEQESGYNFALKRKADKMWQGRFHFICLRRTNETDAIEFSC